MPARIKIVSQGPNRYRIAYLVVGPHGIPVYTWLLDPSAQRAQPLQFTSNAAARKEIERITKCQHS